MSAAGHYIPPIFIFHKKQKKPEQMDKAQPGSIAEQHISCWMQSEIFVKWFEHFLKHCKVSKERPVLLILDAI